MDGATIIAISGLVIGLVFGAVVQRTSFCAMGAISDRVALGDGRRLRAWVLAVAVAALGTHALLALGQGGIDKSAYLAPRVAWLGAALGGLLFGFGMVFAGGCASRTVVKVGAGSLKSLVVFIVMGIVGYATVRGILAPPRLAADAATAIELAGGQGVHQVLGGGALVEIGLVGALVAGALWWCFKDRAFRRSRRDVIAGMALGALVVAGWAATGILAVDPFEPPAPQSLTLIGPAGDTLQYLMTFTGAKLGFGVAVTFGIVAGSAVAALASGTFRLEGFADRADMLRHLGGASLMGLGGVMAGGCTVGQGLTGAATLGLASLLALGGIVAGAVLAIRLLLRDMERAALDKGM